MASSMELEKQLLEAGNNLLHPPSSVEDLLPLLDQVQECLSRVEQSPTQSLYRALSPALKALIADKLIKHSDVDVKVAVATCISEITRITAPDTPYDDDQMKEVFQLIVSSFENVNDTTSRSYVNRTLILETAAKVKSCVVMLDLECDALILEMFQHFFKEIREHHPESVFSYMETIMTILLEQSYEIPLELLSPILASVKKDNEEVLPIAQKLGERVLESCANKLKPYLVKAVNTWGISLDDYSNVLASICQDMPGSLQQNDVCATSEHSAKEAKESEKGSDGSSSTEEEEEEMLPSPKSSTKPTKDEHSEETPKTTLQGKCTPGNGNENKPYYSFFLWENKANGRLSEMVERRVDEMKNYMQKEFESLENEMKIKMQKEFDRVENEFRCFKVGFVIIAVVVIVFVGMIMK